MDQRLKHAGYLGLQDHLGAREELTYPFMNEMTTNLQALPLPTEHDVPTHVLRQAAKQLLAQAIKLKVSACLEAVLTSGAKPATTQSHLDTSRPRGAAGSPATPRAGLPTADQRQKSTSAILPAYLWMLKQPSSNYFQR